MQLTMTRTCDAAPVQYEGTVNGRPFYFRARWDGWYFGVADTVDDATVVSDSTFTRSGTWGSDRYAASYMPFAEAERIIRQCAADYLASDNTSP